MKYVLLLFLCVGCAKQVPKEYTISNYNLKVTASESIGGAISSIQYKNMEYLNTADTGRGMQTTVRDSRVNEFWNPTEGGAVSDGLNSKSIIVDATTKDYSMTIKNQWAFWVGIDDEPTKLSHGPFRAQSTISNVIMDKTVSINNNVIRIDKNIKIGYDLDINLAAEANVIYMVNELNTHYAYNPTTKVITPLQVSEANKLPVTISATADGKHAIAQFMTNFDSKITYSLTAVSSMPDGYNPGKTVYWSDIYATFAKSNNGTYTLTTYVIVGDLQEVLSTLANFNF